jgi:hypothetical protein
VGLRIFRYLKDNLRFINSFTRKSQLIIYGKYFEELEIAERLCTERTLSKRL